MTKIFWIDVREADEFATGHHPEAVNIPYESIVDRIAEVTEDKDADVRVYCRTGRRSGIAKDSLSSIGFSNVTNEGGIEDVMKLV